MFFDKNSYDDDDRMIRNRIKEEKKIRQHLNKKTIDELCYLVKTQSKENKEKINPIMKI